ncbi:predicted protein [Scheffersomyces stipitis CBS 6054]|uniref:Uncharacterized protein n=1 Tax=Scheffersomyces stipitis (strain ATCC 58785 / CBS 6054 / NBRC 10063 / NRRL Y-11545) TaxID=322104 RepID=A3LZ53_PICST|nr:predicted protein [Scheffersomyces stipitis CBS 6054]ABN68096.2 predicted protein [Scheffersomyces stipitis CBS 6054]
MDPPNKLDPLGFLDPSPQSSIDSIEFRKHLASMAEDHQSKKAAASEFSYSASENLNTPQSSKIRTQETENPSFDSSKNDSQLLHLRNQSGASGYEQSKHRLTTDSYGLQTPVLQGEDFLANLHSPASDFSKFKAPRTRESYLSQYSGKVDRVDDMGAQATVKLVRHDSTKKEEKSKDVSTNSVSPSQSSLQSGKEPSIKLGKLPTVTKSYSPEEDSKSPDISYTTNIEGSVPPRSNRRPLSSAVSSSIDNDHSNEDLENSIVENVEKTPDTKFKQRRSRAFSGTLNHDLDQLMLSANSLKSEESHDIPEEQKPTISDTSANLARETEAGPSAKEDFQGFGGNLPGSNITLEPIERPQLQEIPHDEREISNTKSIKSHNSVRSGHSEPDLHPKDSTDTFQTAESPGELHSEKLRSKTPTSSLPPRPSLDNIIRAREASASYQIRESPESEEDENATAKLEEIDNSKEVTQPEQELDVAGEPIVTPHINQGNDDSYIDIEEPRLVHKPSRGKSVKDSTRRHTHKKSKTVKTKQAKGTSANLKPFSYNTLINLLESMNGTIIGEEFSQLNLPMKEKQLIEKIVDSLSRLTSDMVLDQSRYEIGIQRLEKALRVLEGFM